MTLRITCEEISKLRATLRLEGNLVGDWAALLLHECSGLLRACASVTLDLTGVRFVDRAGVAALRRLSRSGIEIRCRPGIVSSVLEEEGIRVERYEDGEDQGQQ